MIYTKPTPHAELIYLSVTNPLILEMAVTERQRVEAGKAIARLTKIDREEAYISLRSVVSGLDLVKALGRHGLSVVTALSESGFDAIESVADGSIEPLSEDAIYVATSVRLSEYAVRQGYRQAYRGISASSSGDKLSPPQRSISEDKAADCLGSSTLTQAPPLSTSTRKSVEASVAPSDGRYCTPRTIKPSSDMGASTTLTLSDSAIDTPHVSDDTTKSPLKFGGPHPVTGRKVYNDTDDLDALTGEAKKHFPGFTNTLKAIAHDIPGVEFHHGEEGHKDMARMKDSGPGSRLQEKLNAGRTPASISDFIGGRVFVDNDDQVNQVMKRLEQWSGEPVKFDEDFIHRGRASGYRARHVQVKVPGSSLSAEVQILPREIGQAQPIAHKFYKAMRGDTHHSLEDRIRAKEAGRHVFDKAYAAYMLRAHGVEVDPAANLFGNTPYEPQTMVAHHGSPVAVPVPDKLSGAPKTTTRAFLDITHPVEEGDPFPPDAATDLDKSLPGWRKPGQPMTVKDGYMAALKALEAAGENDPQDLMHRLLYENGVDGIRFRDAQGSGHWLPMLQSQIYDPSRAQTHAGQVKMSEFAVARGMKPVILLSDSATLETKPITWRPLPDAHKMTRQEYLSHSKNQPPGDELEQILGSDDDWKDGLAKVHENAVKYALVKGEPVDDKVMADYPTLRNGVKLADAAPGDLFGAAGAPTAPAERKMPGIAKPKTPSIAKPTLGLSDGMAVQGTGGMQFMEPGPAPTQFPNIGGDEFGKLVDRLHRGHSVSELLEMSRAERHPQKQLAMAHAIKLHLEKKESAIGR